MTFKQKAVQGLFWSFIDAFANQGVQFIVGIVLANILSPGEFGLIGMLSIFIAISQTFIDSGFSNALIRKKDCSQGDYSTVFFFNLLVGLFFYFVLFATADAISSFFGEPRLKLLLQVLGLGLIVNAFSTIHRIILTKRIDFKLQTRVSIISSVTSGAIGIWMAYAGYGVWSLVFRTLAAFVFTSMLLWLWVRWKPSILFSLNSFRELFSFGSKLLVSGLIDTAYLNIYYVVIGKYFSAQELGYYTRADQFKTLPSQNITSVIQRVAYPILVSIQDDKIRLKANYQKLLRSTMFITFVLMLGMAAIARPMILTLLGGKWEPSVIYLQMLCFVGMFYPLHALNLSMLMLQGRSDLFLRLEIFKKILAVPIIITGIFLGIKAMILGLMASTLIAYFLNSYWSGRFIGYSFPEQIKDIFPSFILALIMSVIIFAEGLLIPLPPLPLLIIQIVTSVTLTLGLCEGFRLKDYLYLKEIAKEKMGMQKEY